MKYGALLKFARANTNRDAPGLVSKRFLLLNKDGSIAYDYFLSLVSAYGIGEPLTRKVMYFLWAYRDERIRRFVCERIADKNGVWRIRQLLKLSNLSFFTKWLGPGAAKKARSNFYRFLVETNLYDQDGAAIHLELDDGWLGHAAIAAAQHEPDPLLRDELLLDPVAFLRRRSWLGLLNGGDSTHLSPLLSIAAGPLEDNTIRTTPSSSSNSLEWNRTKPTASGKATAVINVDMVARERATLSHFLLEKALVHEVKSQGLSPRYNQNIDLFFNTPNGSVLVEVKSCTDSNFHSQFRKAVSQLFEYRFLYKHLLKPKTSMLLLMETSPPKGKEWLVDYAASMEIILAWKSPLSGRIGTSADVPSSLQSILGRF
ncbi:hypothetical protein C2U70_31440 [Bradyrhizobium guangdongense]|nr:hypothetical protein C2U70_31440 [Bradyrhizobium guangdongense]